MEPKSISTKTEWERLSKSIFSDKKEKRKKYRKIISESYKNSPKIKSKDAEIYPNYYLIAKAIDLFTESEFIFKIKDKPGVILECGKKSNPGIHTSLPEKSDQPTYLVCMPHLAGKQDLDKQIQLLFEEGFGQDAEESKQEASERLQLFIGVNYCHSLDPAINREKKKYIKKLLKQEAKPNISFESFCWSPKWDCQNKEIEKGEVSQTRVKQLFRLLQEIDSKKASEIYKKVMKEKVVPYQSIREEIIHSQSFTTYFNKFRKNRKDRPCWLSVRDNDTVKLRTMNIGSYSNFDRMITENKHLKVATTGYYMIDPNNLFVEVASVSSLIAKSVTATEFRGSAAYPPEPNVIFKIPNGKILSRKISFLTKSNKGGSLESLGMLENLGLMKGESEGKIKFEFQNPMQTAVSPNVKIPKHLQGNVTGKSFLIPKNLASLRKLSQSALNPRNFATSILRTFPKGFNTGTNKGTVGDIYKAFDPIEYAKVLPKIWLKAHPCVAEKVFKTYLSNDSDFLDKVESKNELFIEMAKSIVEDLKLEKTHKKPIAKLIGEKSISLHNAYKLLSKFKHEKNGSFTPDNIHDVMYTAFRVNESVYYYLKMIIKNR